MKAPSRATLSPGERAVHSLLSTLYSLLSIHYSLFRILYSLFPVPSCGTYSYRSATSGSTFVALRAGM
jgi:hypothetical protein